jgi:beta-galactosidase
VKYTPGELKVVSYKNGEPWATESLKTVGEAAKLELTADRNKINADGTDLSFITVKVMDKDGNLVPEATHHITFSITGPAELIATDNGDPADLVAFPSKDRKAFSGMALAIVRSVNNQSGEIIVTAKAEGLTDAKIGLSSDK